MIGWDHPATAERYERFCRRHSRYRKANEALVREAALVPGLRVLDVGAGTGRTAAAALPALGPDGSVLCVEPAAAMREVGMRRLRDPRVTWRAELPWADVARAAADSGKSVAGQPHFEPIDSCAQRPAEADRFDRILSGAAIWQMAPLEESIRRLAGLLRPGGALCFDIPALYLGEPDEPGGGRDPLLLDLQGCLGAWGESSNASAASSWQHEPVPSSTCQHEPVSADAWQYDAAAIDALLRAAGLEPHTWAFQLRLTQTAYARWLTIPVLTDRLFSGVDPEDRDRRIESALGTVDRRSWRWERWRGWTAWKR